MYEVSSGSQLELFIVLLISRDLLKMAVEVPGDLVLWCPELS